MSECTYLTMFTTSLYDSLRADDLSAMSGPDEFTEFYRRLKGIRDYHNRHPNELEEPMALEFVKLDQQRTHPPEELQSKGTPTHTSHTPHTPYTHLIHLIHIQIW